MDVKLVYGRDVSYVRKLLTCIYSNIHINIYYTDAPSNRKGLVKNTRECPKCAAFIEKAGGCNWIKCGRCTFEFCWLCSRAMKHSEVDAAGGNHKCNVFKEGEEKEVSARKEDQEKVKMADERRRFAHYHSR